MSTKRQTFKQLSEITCVSYRTMLAWRKSRPELIDCLLNTSVMDKVIKLQSEVNDLQSDNDSLKAKIKQIHEATKG